MRVYVSLYFTLLTLLTLSRNYCEVFWTCANLGAVANRNHPVMLFVGPKTGNSDDHMTASAHARRHVEVSQAVMHCRLVKYVKHAHR